MHFVRHSSLG